MKQTISKDSTEESTVVSHVSHNTDVSTVVSIKDDYIENAMTDNQRYFLVSAIEYGSIRGLTTESVINWILAITTKDGKEEYDGEMDDIKQSLRRLCDAWDLKLDIITKNNGSNGGQPPDEDDGENNANITNSNSSSNSNRWESLLSNTHVRQDLIKRLMDRAKELKIADGVLIGPKPDILRLVIDTLLVLPERPIVFSTNNNNPHHRHIGRVGSRSVGISTIESSGAGAVIGSKASHDSNDDNYSTSTGLTTNSSTSGSSTHTTGHHEHNNTTTSSSFDHHSNSQTTTVKRWDIFYDGLTKKEQKYLLQYWKQDENYLELQDVTKVIICLYLKTTQRNLDDMTFQKFEKRARKTIQKVAIQHNITLA